MSLDEKIIPSLSEFVDAFGPIEGAIPNKKSTKPLCDNIFDVQRSELFEVFESLKTAFWSDSTNELPIPITTDPLPIIESPVLEPTLLEDTITENRPVEKEEIRPHLSKRRLSDDQEGVVSKKPRLIENKVEPTSQKTRINLWSTKLAILRLLKATRYDEEKLLLLLSNTKNQLTSTEQLIHLINYFKPVAKETRRWNIVEALNKMV